MDERRIGQVMRGDLDWIVMKALEKDRTRRYESASALAADVQRYLADEPIEARPPTLAHRAAKWTRRHRTVVWSTAVVVFVVTVTGEALLWTGHRRATQLEWAVGTHLAASAVLLKSGNYTAADREIAEARGHLKAEGYVAGPLTESVTRLTAEIAARIEAIERFEQFQSLRHRIYSETYVPDHAVRDDTREHCRAALGLFGVFESNRWKAQSAFETPGHRTSIAG